MKMLMNMQGMVFTEKQAREYYGNRFESAILAIVEIYEDGQVVNE